MGRKRKRSHNATDPSGKAVARDPQARVSNRKHCTPNEAENPRSWSEGFALRYQRLALLGELAAGMAHELRNPLQGMVSYLALLRMHAHDPERVRALANRMGEGLQEMEHLIAQMLDLVPDETAKPGPVAIGHLVEKAWSLLSIKARKRQVRIELDLQPGLPPLQVDSGRMVEALLCVLKNAVNASPEGGLISVRVAQDEDDPRMIRLHVTDSGPGIPLEHRERVFEPFFTAGVDGLGLALARRAAGDCGGEVAIADTSLRGTTVALRWPAVRPGHARAAASCGAIG